RRCPPVQARGCAVTDTRHHQIWGGVSPPEARSSPIKGIAVIPEVVHFVLSRDRFVSVDAGAVLDLLFRDRDGQYLFRPIRTADRKRGDQHLAIRKPATGVHNEITDN